MFDSERFFVPSIFLKYVPHKAHPETGQSPLVAGEFVVTYEVTVGDAVGLVFAPDVADSKSEVERE